MVDIQEAGFYAEKPFKNRDWISLTLYLKKLVGELASKQNWLRERSTHSGYHVVRMMDYVSALERSISIIHNRMASTHQSFVQFEPSRSVS